MATKAQLMAELDVLKQQMASRDTLPETPHIEADTLSEAEDPDADPKSHLNNLLAAHGIVDADLDALWSKFSGEIKDLSRDKPLLTTAAAFGLGFALGRVSK